MEDDKKVEVIYGEHKGKIGVVTGMFWGANTTLIKTDDGEEIAVRPNEIITIAD